jgi:hypothetical protein
MVRTRRLDRVGGVAQLSVTKEAETQHRFGERVTQLADSESRVKLMGGGEVLGTALIMWLKSAEDEIGVARRVVKAVWPRVGTKRPQTPEWAESCDTKMDLVTKIESWLRTNSARCERHLIKLEYVCPGCQHGMCTICNDIESRTQ